MGRHSVGGGGHSPFDRKHEHLAKGKTGRVKPARSVARGSDRVRGERLPDAASRRNGPLESAPARLRAERERRRGRYRRIALGVAGGILVLLLLAAGGVYVYAKRIESAMQKSVVKTEELNVELTKSKPAEPFTILLLGGDDKPGTPQHRTDTMILARIDPKEKRVWMLSIPRDTRVNIPGVGYDKINAAYFHGGPSLAVKTVSEFTGVPINHYMEVDFNGFKKAVEAMGGVWVDVPVEIDDIKAAGYSRNREAIKHIDPGYQLLDGDHALVFVRSRKFADADFSRMKHQQVFFKALADQIASKENLAELPKVVSAVAPYVATDLSLLEMIKSALALKAAGSKNVYTATVAGEWRSPYVWPDDEQKQKLVDLMLAGRSFDGTKSAEPTGTASSSAVPAAKDAEDITVVVRNGAGIAGCAKQASSILKARAFNVGEVGNANQFVYEDTLVVYKTDEAAAEMVAAALPPGTKVVESRGMYSFDGDVLVVIGKDWDLSKIPVTPVVTN